MVRELCVIGLLSYGILSGCTSTSQAIWMDPQDVDESIRIRESKAIKFCGQYNVAGNLNGVLGAVDAMGSMHGVVAIGKEMSFQECLQSIPHIPQNQP